MQITTQSICHSLKIQLTRCSIQIWTHSIFYILKNSHSIFVRHRFGYFFFNRRLLFVLVDARNRQTDSLLNPFLAGIRFRKHPAISHPEMRSCTHFQCLLVNWFSSDNNIAHIPFTTSIEKLEFCRNGVTIQWWRNVIYHHKNKHIMFRSEGRFPENQLVDFIRDTFFLNIYDQYFFKKV